MEQYKVELAPEVMKQIRSLKDYIEVVLQSPLSAERTVARILKDLESLSFFPDRGFDADEKVGVKTRGIVIAKNTYLAFYTVDESTKKVYITHLVPSKSDYAQLFQDL